MIFLTTIGDRDIRLDVQSKDGRHTITLEEYAPHLDLVRLSPYSYSLLVDGQSHHLHVRSSRDGYEVTLRQHIYHVRLRDELDLTIEKMGLKDTARDHSGKVRAAIPGLIASVAVAVGDEVAAGDQLLVLEAMKMENEITAPMSGTVEAVHVSPGDAVEKGTPLVKLKGH